MGNGERNPLMNLRRMENHAALLLGVGIVVALAVWGVRAVMALF